MAEPIIPSIAARKAARKKSQYATEMSSTPAPEAQAEQTQPVSAASTAITTTVEQTPTEEVSSSPPINEVADESIKPTDASSGAEVPSEIQKALAKELAPTSPRPTPQPSAMPAIAAPLISASPSPSQPVPPMADVPSIIPTPAEIENAKVKAQTFVQAPLQTAPRSSSQSSALISREMLLRLAKEHGLDLAPQKREFTKHTYSITPDRKDMMKQFTTVLGINMQDAICEAFDLFFEKHQATYDAITRARDKRAEDNA